MSVWQFIQRSILYHWRINFVVALGVAAATAVLTGALLVGDSVRGSLRDLSLDRLGKIDALLIAQGFFREELASDLQSSDEFKAKYEAVAPAIIFPRGTVEATPKETTNRASSVLVVGCDETFWTFDRHALQPSVLPGEDEIVLNQPLADELQVTTGDTVTVRLPDANAIPADSPLGEKEDRIRGITELQIVDIVPAEGLGRFSLNPSQSLALTCFVSMSTLQDALDQDGRVNAMLVAAKPTFAPPDEVACQQLSLRLRPQLSDIGLTLKRVRMPFATDEEEVEIYDYFTLSSDRMVIDDEAARVAELAFAADHAQPVLTYLGNAIIKQREGDEQVDADGVRYSTIAAVDSTPQLGPLQSADDSPLPPLANDEIIINSWAAADQDIEVGDKVTVFYFEPETTHGEEVESSDEFTVKAIAPLTDPDTEFDGDTPPVYSKRPALINDRHLTPAVKGITDRESIEDWNVPFELTRGTKEEDDDYYRKHRLTPKAFVSFDVGQELWSSRFGSVTSIRIPAPKELTLEETDQFAKQLANKFFAQARRDNATLDLNFTPVKSQAIAASAGTTPFDGLFIGLSLFIIAAALMLVFLLFRLGIEQRAEEVGLLLATGFTRQRAGRLFVAEGGLVAIIGGLLGVALGIGYAWLTLAGLRTIWVGAITTPFLQFHWTPRSLALGYVLGVAVSALTIVWSVRQLKKVAARRLLAGQAAEANVVTSKSANWGRWISTVLLAVAVILLFAATGLGGEAQAGCFVGGGIMILAALLLLIRRQLRSAGGRAATSLSAVKLAVRNAARNPGRSTLTIGLIATASFLIVAMSSFRLNPSLDGAGGFQLIAESSEPIYADLSDPALREEYMATDAELLDGATVLALRLKPGDDASCNNLYKATSPRVLGVTDAMIEYYDDAELPFEWASAASLPEGQHDNPWHLLDDEAEDGAIPVVIDKNTAMYSMQIYAVGQTKTFKYEDAGEVTFRVVGMLSNSVLQGNLLISEANFQRAFPNVSGYQYFMIKSDAGEPAQVSGVLEETFGDQGLDVRDANYVLTSLMAVQNTYLSTFQSLGALGLLLGTFGLVTVQVRNVLERRGEMALLRAAGFARARLSQIVMYENLLLLFGGLATGVIAALFAVLPHYLFGNASIPGWELSGMLVTVAIVGVVTAYATMQRVLRTPILSALRGD